MKKYIILFLALAVMVAITACSKPDVSGRWKVTLKWDKRAVFQGEPPPPTILQLHLKEGLIYHDEKEVGNYKVKGDRLKLKIRKMKIICYGDLEKESRCRGDISYYPAGEIYGTWTGKRYHGGK